MLKHGLESNKKNRLLLKRKKRLEELSNKVQMRKKMRSHTVEIIIRMCTLGHIVKWDDYFLFWK
jgi:hypothetical protein